MVLQFKFIKITKSGYQMVNDWLDNFYSLHVKWATEPDQWPPLLLPPGGTAAAFTMRVLITLRRRPRPRIFQPIHGCPLLIEIQFVSVQLLIKTNAHVFTWNVMDQRGSFISSSLQRSVLSSKINPGHSSSMASVSSRPSSSISFK